MMYMYVSLLCLLMSLLCLNSFSSCAALTLGDKPFTLETEWSSDKKLKSCRDRWERLLKFNGRNSKAKAQIYNDARYVQKNNKKKVLYVHVGKTGGETIYQHYLNNFTNLHAQQLHVHALDHEMVRL